MYVYNRGNANAAAGVLQYVLGSMLVAYETLAFFGPLICTVSTAVVAC